MLKMEALILNLGGPTKTKALVFSLGALMMFLLLLIKSLILTCLG